MKCTKTHEQSSGVPKHSFVTFAAAGLALYLSSSMGYAAPKSTLHFAAEPAKFSSQYYSPSAVKKAAKQTTQSESASVNCTNSLSLEEKIISEKYKYKKKNCELEE